MVLTRSKYENILKEELIEQLVSHDNIAAKLSELTKRFDEFSDKYEALHSELKISQNCSPFFWSVFTSWNVMLLVIRSTTGEKH